MGRIGTEVAKRAIAFGMRVIAYDPYLTEDRAKAIGAEFAASVDARLSRGGFHHRPHAGDDGNEGHAERRRVRQDEARRENRELRARRNHCRDRSDRRAGIGQGGRRGAGRFCRRTAARRPSVSQAAEFDFDAAPRREHRTRRRKNAASKSPKSSPAICSPAKSATR